MSDNVAVIVENKLSLLRREIEKHRTAKFDEGQVVFSLDSGLKILITPLVNRYLRGLSSYAEGEDGYTTELFGIPCEVVDEPGIFITLSIKF